MPDEVGGVLAAERLSAGGSTALTGTALTGTALTGTALTGTALTGTVLAKVLRVDGASVEVRTAAGLRVAARLAAHGYEPRAGDAVLVTAADDGGYYVIGAVRALRTADRLEAKDGARAELDRDETGAEVLRLRDAAGRILIEHRPDEGRTIIAAPRDLRFVAGGDVTFDAGGAVRIDAASDVEVRGRGEVAIAASDPEGIERSALRFREGESSLRAERMGVKLERLDAVVREANVVARTLRTVAGRVKQEVEELEVRAGQIFERAKESWRETEGLSQTRAGRLRLVAEDSLYAMGRRAQLKADEDVKIKGDKIHLG